jgi:hypothetical protein
MVKELFLARNPILCGLMTFRFKLILHKAGIAIVNACGTVLFAGHLYNAVQQEGLLHQDVASWTDMEMAIKYHGENGFFFGDRPKCAEDYYKQNCLLVGHSASNFAKNRRNIPMKISSKGRVKAFRTSAPVSFMFADRVLDAASRTNFTLEEVEKIINKARTVSQESATNADHATPYQFPSDHITQSKPGLAKKLRKQWEKHHNCTPVQLLSTLQTALQDEVPELFFDYLLLHRNCWKVIQLIKEAADEQLSSIYGPNYLENDMQLCCLVILILARQRMSTKFA